MKWLPFIWIVSMIACDNSSKVVQAYIPGTYISQGVGTYSQVWDTLVITKRSSLSNNYEVARHVTYRRLEDGKLLAPKHLIESWSCLYNESDKILYESQKGKTISLLPEQNALLVGNSRYQKIK
jgi:hypothetical protein